jgi:glycosyltransferase involved in cell wall biosynthesis
MNPSVLVISEYGAVVPVRPEAEVFVALARGGFGVTVMTPPGGPYAERLRAAGARVIEWHPERKASPAAIRRIRAELREGRHDVLFLFNNRALANGVWAAMGLPVKVVAYRGYDGNVGWWDPTNYLKLLHPRIDAYWCNADSVRDTIRRNLPFGRDRAVSIPKGHDVRWYEGTPRADLAALGVPAGAFVVTFAANVRPMKGMPYLLQATHHVPRERNVHLLVAGAGMDDPGLRRLVGASPMRERIHVLGPRGDVASLLAASDGYVLSSVKGESLTKSLMEAMCLGIPPVVTDVPGNRGIVVDRECGRVVPIRDAAALGAAIADLASDRARARAWGAAARERIRTRWSHEATVERVAALVRRLADGRAGDAAPEPRAPEGV